MEKRQKNSPAGLMSMVLSIGIIASSFLPLLQFILSVSTWDVCIGLLSDNDGGIGLWISISYLVYLAMHAINIIIQANNCNREYTSSLATLGTIFVVMFIIGYNSMWSVVGVGFYAIAIQVLLLYVAAGLPAGDDKDDYESLGDIIRDAAKERKKKIRTAQRPVAPSDRTIEIQRLKEKVSKLESDKKADEELHYRRRREEQRRREEEYQRRKELQNKEKELRKREELRNREEELMRRERELIHREKLLQQEAEEQRNREAIMRKHRKAAMQQDSSQFNIIIEDDLIDESEIEIIG